MLNHLSMAYLLSIIYTKNYRNRTTIVEIIVGGSVLFFLRHSVDYFTAAVTVQVQSIVSLVSADLCDLRTASVCSQRGQYFEIFLPK